MPSRLGSSLDWDKLRIFHAVADAGSFTHAGDTLNLSQSAVSRQISALEESLSVALFHRHARGLILTEQGELLYQTVHDVFAKLAMAEARLSDSTDRPQGQLRITTTAAFGAVWLTTQLKEFLEAYPQIEVSLILDDEDALDLAMREADVAIRFRPPRQPDLVQRQLMSLRYLVYAAPEYLKKHGIPKNPQDLKNHRIIIYTETMTKPVENMNWLIEYAGDSITPALQVNSIYGMFRAAQSGLGIAALPDYFASESTNLVQVLPELEGPSLDAFFVYPEELRHSKRVTVFRDFLIQRLSHLVAAKKA